MNMNNKGLDVVKKHISVAIKHLTSSRDDGFHKGMMALYRAMDKIDKIKEDNI